MAVSYSWGSKKHNSLRGFITTLPPFHSFISWPCVSVLCLVHVSFVSFSTPCLALYCFLRAGRGINNFQIELQGRYELKSGRHRNIDRELLHSFFVRPHTRELQRDRAIFHFGTHFLLSLLVRLRIIQNVSPTYTALQQD